MSTNIRAFDSGSVAGSTDLNDKRAKSSAGQSSGQTLDPTQPSSRAHSAMPSRNVPQPGSPTRGRKATGQAALSTLKGSMKFLSKGCEIFPPLEPAAETLLDASSLIDTTTQDERSSELHGLAASELPQWAIILSAYISDSQPERMSKGIEALVQVLRDQAEYIRAQQRRGRMRRFVESEQDIEELEQCYRHIEASFRQLQADASLSTWRNTDKQLKDSQLNALSPAHDARYDSSFSDKIERAGCFQNTRVAVLERIRDWIYSFGAEKIYWMNGMAGTGKTTIAYSVCTELEQNGRLGASFFCSRASPECRDVSRIIPTIAYHLAQQSYPFRSALCRVLEKEANIGQRKISVQLEYLIRTPLLEVKEVLQSGVVVVIDALDECSDLGTTEMMLDALFRLAADLPVRFFLTSRPESSISNTILAQVNNSRSVLHLHNVEEQFVKADIETYLTVTLAKLSLTENQIKQVAEQAGILFIYAATVARYLLTAGRGVNASARLAAVLSGGTSRSSKKDREIDRLYKTILDGALGDEMLEESEIEVIKLVLWTVVCVREPVMRSTLGALLSLDDEQVEAALQPLRSVLHVSEGSEVVSTLHASFPDFMLSSERSGSLLYCDEAAQSNYLARRCLEVMEEQLRFNICGLETSYLFDEEVPDLKDRVEAAISSELFYACLYWAEHLRRSVVCDELVSGLDSFLHERLLFWMEVLNLKGWMGNGEKVLVGAQNWLLGGHGPPEACEFIRDARDL